jgi:hypothetical protein
MKAIRPGLNIRVVTDIDPFKETISVRPSTIYDVNGERLIIAQTEPRIVRTDHEVVVTYLTNHKEEQRRGFPAQIADIIQYELAGGQMVEALVALRKGAPGPYSVRMFHRVEPADDIPLRLFINGIHVQIVDISLRGARFRHNGELPPEAGTAVKVSIDIGPRSYDFEGHITRRWDDEDFLVRRQSTFASVEFVTLGGAAERALLHRLREIERDYMRKQSNIKAQAGENHPAESE